MSACGTTFQCVRAMSALPPKADVVPFAIEDSRIICCRPINGVCFVMANYEAAPAASEDRNSDTPSVFLLADAAYAKLQSEGRKHDYGRN
jgi:hypothetical protein